MSMLTDSLTRLYKSGRISLETMKGRVKKGTITAEEFEKITGVKYEETTSKNK